HAVSARERTRVFAWYNVAGYLASAIGALVVGLFVAALNRAGWSDLTAYRAVFYAYAVCGAVLALLSRALSPAVEAPGATISRGAGVLGLHESRHVVLRLSALFALDSFGGGFVLQSFLAWWFQ